MVMNITYTVNSNFSFYEKSTKVLFDSLDATNQNWRQNFTIIVGESPFTEIKIINGVKHCFVEYGGIDFTAALYIANNQDQFNEYIFYTHDTVYVGPNFFNLVKKDFIGKYYKRLRARWGMNMGLFKKELFLKYKDVLETLRFKEINEETRRKYKIIGLKYEDIICRLADEDKEIINNQYSSESYQYNNDEVYFKENIDIYNTGILRNIVYIPELDFYKVKANIGSKLYNEWIINL